MPPDPRVVAVPPPAGAPPEPSIVPVPSGPPTCATITCVGAMTASDASYSQADTAFETTTSETSARPDLNIVAIHLSATGEI